jgi:uncharacterized protein (DUF1501 family)
MLSRRDFLVNTCKAFLGAALTPYLFSTGLTKILTSDDATKPSLSKGKRTLVIVQLSGGNDGVNTIIPYGTGYYYDNRPTIRIPQSDVLAINHEIGFNPNLPFLNEEFKNNKLAILQGVGYPTPNRSHFTSMDIWHTADIQAKKPTGWLASYMMEHPKTAQVRAVQIGNSLCYALLGDVNVPVVPNLQAYSVKESQTMLHSLDQLYHTGLWGDSDTAVKTTSAGYFAHTKLLGGLKQSDSQYPASGIGRDLQTAASIIKGNVDAEILYTIHGGYDHHENLAQYHPTMLKTLDEALKAFMEDLRNSKLSEQVTVLIFSEFGRRLKENGSKGTDHGAASVMMALGDSVKGDLYGEYPSLNKLEDGDLKFTMDFRSVYATVIDSWLQGNHKSVLGRTFETLPIFL